MLYYYDEEGVKREGKNLKMRGDVARQTKKMSQEEFEQLSRIFLILRTFLSKEE